MFSQHESATWACWSAEGMSQPDPERGNPMT